MSTVIMDKFFVLRELAIAPVFATFFCAGILKLRRGYDGLPAFEAVGFSGTTSRLMARYVPYAELIFSIMLLFSFTVRLGELALFILLLAFSSGILILMRKRATLSCNCFGGVGVAPIGMGLLIRNLTLLAALIVSFISSRTEPLGLVNMLIALPRIFEIKDLLYFFWAALICLNLLFFHRLMLGHGQTLLRLEKIEQRLKPQSSSHHVINVGLRVPNIKFTFGDQSYSTLDELLNGNQTIFLVFVDNNCQHCKTLLKKWAESAVLKPPIYVIPRTDEFISKASVEYFGISSVLSQIDDGFISFFGIEMFPSAFSITQDRRISSKLAVGEYAINSLVNGQ